MALVNLVVTYDTESRSVQVSESMTGDIIDYTDQVFEEGPGDAVWRPATSEEYRAALSAVTAVVSAHPCRSAGAA